MTWPWRHVQDSNTIRHGEAGTHHGQPIACSQSARAPLRPEQGVHMSTQTRQYVESLAFVVLILALADPLRQVGASDRRMVDGGRLGLPLCSDRAWAVGRIVDGGRLGLPLCSDRAWAVGRMQGGDPQSQLSFLQLARYIPRSCSRSGQDHAIAMTAPCGPRSRELTATWVEKTRNQWSLLN